MQYTMSGDLKFTSAAPLTGQHDAFQAADGITIHFTRNRQLLTGYKRLRNELYKTDPSFVGFRYFSYDEAENYDERGQMLIVSKGDECLGGMRVHMSLPSNHRILELEQDILPPKGQFYFSLREQFPQLELDKYGYAEFGRFVLHPSVRSRAMVMEMVRSALMRCFDHRIRYFLGLSDKMRNRLYRNICTSLKVECKILDDFDIPMRPEYEGVQMYLLVGDMKKLYVSPSDPDAACLLDPLNQHELD